MQASRPQKPKEPSPLSAIHLPHFPNIRGLPRHGRQGTFAPKNEHPYRDRTKIRADGFIKSIMNTLISQTEHGSLFHCTTCRKIHIEFNNLLFTFTDSEFRFFSGYFRKLNGQQWEEMNQQLEYRRKIIVPVGHRNLQLLLNNRETEEMRRLLNIPAESAGLTDTKEIEEVLTQFRRQIYGDRPC